MFCKICTTFAQHCCILFYIAANDTVTAYRHSVISCKLKQNANEGCATVVQVLQDLFYCMFYFTCGRSFIYTNRATVRVRTAEMGVIVRANAGRRSV